MRTALNSTSYSSSEIRALSRVRHLLLLALFLSPGVNGQATDRQGREILPENLYTHMEFLASDRLEGRGTGTPGAEKAAHYIAELLDSYGLKPASNEDDYFQRIPMRGSTPLMESRLRIWTEGEELSLDFIDDYLLFKTGAQTFVPNPAPMVFAGYGIIAPEFDYNDYQRIDAEGKVVVFLSGEPPSSDSSYFAGRAPTIHSYPEAKQRVALSRGARGSIMIPNRREEEGRSWEFWKAEFSFEHITLAYSAAGNLSLLIKPTAAQNLLRGTKHSLDELYRMDEQGKLPSFTLKTKVSFQGRFQQREFISPNVVALLEGGDQELKDEYLIISSHYDHLGRGPAIEGDFIYNGLFDNASGVSALLEMGRVWSTHETAPRRSVIFLFTTGEEKGLLGARYYTDHPVVPLHKTVANINVDGLALFDTFDDLVGVGSELSTLGPELESFLKRRGLRLSQMPPTFSRAEAFIRSDQAAFAEAGVPSLLVMEGLSWRHTGYEEALARFAEWGDTIYHSPFDDLNQPIDLNAAAQHCRIVFDFCRWLANSSFYPEWNRGSPYVRARLQSIAERR